MELKKGLTTTQIIAAGFFVAIVIGTLLLMLPISSKSGQWTNPLDAAFMATTSICVTGLVTVVPAAYFSYFGQLVMLFLIQFGGLGVVTFTTTVLLIMRKRITLKERMLIQDAYNLDTLRGLVKLTIRILKGTLIVEAVGAVLFAIPFVSDYGPIGIWMAIFNSVSAFCNAGIDILGDSSLQVYQSNVLVNFTTMALIILGGLGFPVWWNVLDVLKERKKKNLTVKKTISKLDLHAKLVLVVTLILIFGGALLIFILEFNNPDTIGGFPVWKKCMVSLFQSVTTRTAGFLTIPQECLRDTTTLICILLMFIGGSPSGTAGGVKTVTVAMMILAVYSIIKGKEDTEIFNRKITGAMVKKGMAVVLISLAILLVSTILLSTVENAPFLDIIYETTSALATVGLSRNFTMRLSELGKIIIIITMYIGRIGPITLALFFNRSKGGRKERTLPAGKIIVG